MYIYCFGSFNSNSLLIAHSKQCVPTRKTRGIIKIKRFAQRLTNRACTGDERRVLTYCFISYMINFLGGGGVGRGIQIRPRQTRTGTNLCRCEMFEGINMKPVGKYVVLGFGTK